MSGRTDIFERAMNQGHSAAWDQSWESAASSYREALSEFPDDLKALTNLGLCLFQLEKFEQALTFYLKATSVSPDDPLPLEKAAEICEQLGKIDQATLARLKAAELYFRNRELEKSVDNFLIVIRLDPRNLRAHSRLAVIFEHTGRKKRAAREYLILANLIQRSGDNEKALQAAQYALKIEPQNNEAKQAILLLNSSKPLPEFKQRIVTDQLRKPVEKASDNSERSEQIFSRVDPVAEARKRAMVLLASMVFDELSGDKELKSTSLGSQSIFNGSSGTSYSQQSKAPEIRSYLSQALDMLTRGELEQASQEIEKVIEAGLNHPAAFFIVGFLKSQRKDLEGAVLHLQRAISNQDLALGSRLLLGQTYRRLGRIEKATIEYLEALKLADSKMVPEIDVNDLVQLYESLIAAETQRTDIEAKQRLCDNIEEILMRGDWLDHLAQVRKELLVGDERGSINAIAEILLEARSGQIVESINRIRQLTRDGYLRSAMEEAFYALDYAPTYLPLHLDIGELLLQLDRYHEAIEKFDAVAHTYNMRGELGRAIDLYRRVIKLSPIEINARNRLIKLLVEHGQLKEAIAEYQSLAEVYYNMADLNEARQTYLDAYQLAQEKIMNREIKAQILRSIADIDLQSLDWRQALEIYEQVRRLKPDDPKVRIHLVDLNFHLSKNDQAIIEVDDFLRFLIKRGEKDQAVEFLKELIGEYPDKAILQQRMDGLSH
jgi:tetratricopeptide (TPR) repeat protein